jgi:hypothetical protein
MFIVYNIYIISIISYQNVVFKTNNNSNNKNNYYYLEEKNVGTILINVGAILYGRIWSGDDFV